MEHILVRGTNWLGDCLLSMPALKSLNRKFPDAVITMIIRSHLRELYEYCPYINHVIVYDPGYGIKRIADFARLIRSMWSVSFTKAVLFQNAFEAACIAFTLNIPLRTGYARQMRGPLLTHPLKWSIHQNRHQVYNYLDIVSVLGAEINNPQLEIFPGTEHEKEADRLLSTHHMDEETTIIGLAPGASYGPSKRWPLNRYIELAQRLVKESGAYIIVFGGTAERKMGEEIVSYTGDRSCNLAGVVSVLTSAALMKKTALIITNDSGAMHLGVASGSKIVALFGPTNPVETGPLGPGHVVIQNPCTCAPCLYRECPEDHQCMKSITVNQVYSEIIRILRDTK